MVYSTFLYTVIKSIKMQRELIHSHEFLFPSNPNASWSEESVRLLVNLAWLELNLISCKIIYFFSCEKSSQNFGQKINVNQCDASRIKYPYTWLPQQNLRS